MAPSMYGSTANPRMISQPAAVASGTPMFPNHTPPPPPPPQASPQQSQGSQSSILGLPPNTAPLNPHMFPPSGAGPPPPPPGAGGGGGPPQAFQPLQNRAPPVQGGMPGMFGHQLDANQAPPPPGGGPMPPPAASSLIQPPPIHPPPPPFGINIPGSFPAQQQQQGAVPQNINGQPGQGFGGQQPNTNLGSTLKEVFPSNMEPSIITGMYNYSGV